ncbi:MAG: hypothetical protein AAFQ87_13810 [Bacteroidota bacterium]
MKFSLLAVLSVFLLASCDTYTPYARPMGFPRIEVPGLAERSYLKFENQVCPFTFAFPEGGTITRDLSDSCWVDIRFPRYNLTWHITHRQTNETRTRASHYEDYRRLIYKHSKKATQITEEGIGFQNGYGVLFEIYGNVGTPAQLFYSDSSGSNIAMLSFYFQTAEKNDSLRPITDYMKEEVLNMARSIVW